MASPRTTTKLRELRSGRGLSQQDVAERTGLTRQSVGAIESGRYVPNTAVALALARCLACRVEDLFAEEQPSVQASALVAAPLAYLMSNDFERVTVEGLTVDVASQETVQTAAIQRAWLERSGPLRPGAAVPLKVLLRTYRGETRTETIPLRVPANAPEGTYALLVSDANAMTSLEQREMRQPFVPRDLDQLVRAINGLRHNNHLYVRLIRPEAGAIVGGEYMQSLPPSVLSVLGSGESGVVPIRTASVWDYDLPTPFALSGSRVLSVSVER